MIDFDRSRAIVIGTQPERKCQSEDCRGGEILILRGPTTVPFDDSNITFLGNITWHTDCECPKSATGDPK